MPYHLRKSKNKSEQNNIMLKLYTIAKLSKLKLSSVGGTNVDGRYSAYCLEMFVVICKENTRKRPPHVHIQFMLQCLGAV